MTRFFQCDMNPPSPWRRVSNVPCSPSPVAASFQLAVSPSHVAASFQLAVSPSHVAASFQLAECGHLPAAAMRRRGRQSFRRSEIPTCHPERHGTHNKSDILLVSSTFADPRLPVPPWRRVSNLPCSPFPRGGEFLTCRAPRSPVAASFQLAEFRNSTRHAPVARTRTGSKPHHDAFLGTHDPDFPELTCET